MMYIPATTLTTPVVLQETPQYYMFQPTTMIPAVPILNTTLIYPRYGFVATPVETSVKKNDTEKSQLQEVPQTVQHVIHHHVQPCSIRTCPGYCELCCPWIEHSPERRHSRSRSRSPSPPTRDQQQLQRYSRRDEFDRTNTSKHETIDDKIERIRHELNQTSFQPYDKSTETIDHYHPPSTFDHHTPYKQHYDPPKSRSRSRSTSSQRASSLTREPWRSSNQNNYPWRDSHLPAYREATLARTQTPTHESRAREETAHERSHSNTRNSTSYYNRKDYIYRPKSETEARKWYTQSTGKDPDREVYQALHGGTTTKYNATGSSTPYYGTNYDHSFYSDVPTTSSKTHTLRKIDSTPYHNLYGCNEPCLHVVPKQGSTLDPPYLKILNAPVTYLH